MTQHRRSPEPALNFRPPAAGTGMPGWQTGRMAELDGKPVSPEQLQALALVNLGHFTSMRVDDGAVRGLTLHLRRLVRDCRTVFDADLDAARVRDLVRQALLAQGSAGSCTVRVTVFDPALNLGHTGGDAAPHILITVRPATTSPPPPLTVQTRPFQREMATVKHTGLFASLHHRRRAQRAGFDDALFTHPDTGLVSEGVTWNAGFIDADGNVLWPDADVLPGVTLHLLRESGHGTVRPLHRDQLPTLRAAFATNTSIGVRPVAAIDDIPLRTDHPALTALQETYAKIEAEPL